MEQTENINIQQQNQNSSEKQQPQEASTPQQPAYFEIKAMELDALKETANIGTGNASIALSNIFKRKPIR